MIARLSVLAAAAVGDEDGLGDGQLLEVGGVGDEGGRAAGDAVAEGDPGEEPAAQVERVRQAAAAGPGGRGEDGREDGRVDGDHGQRVDDVPGQPQAGAGVPVAEVGRGVAPDERAVAGRAGGHRWPGLYHRPTAAATNAPRPGWTPRGRSPARPRPTAFPPPGRSSRNRGRSATGEVSPARFGRAAHAGGGRLGGRAWPSAAAAAGGSRPACGGPAGYPAAPPCC